MTDNTPTVPSPPLVAVPVELLRRAVQGLSTAIVALPFGDGRRLILRQVQDDLQDVLTQE